MYRSISCCIAAIKCFDNKNATRIDDGNYKYDDPDPGDGDYDDVDDVRVQKMDQSG
uniref:Uncharacterized protein n=1 Tax=Tetranychus urticae TaxID=32264 RepID=T1KUZ4_TETUR